MATVSKMKKAQMGKSVSASKKKGAVDSVESEMFPGKMIPKSKSNYENGFNIATGKQNAPKKSVPKKKMKAGGSLKPVAADQKGLSKLPTAVRNKMGYQKTGGMTKKAMYGVDMTPDAMMKMGGKAKKAMSGTMMYKSGGKAKKMMKTGGKMCKYGC